MKSKLVCREIFGAATNILAMSSISTSIKATKADHLIKVKNCCHSTKQASRFDAVVGDHVLVRRDMDVYLGGVIHSIPSVGNVTVTLFQGDQITVTASDIAALIIED